MDGSRGIYTLADCVSLLKQPRETVREWTLKGLAPTRRKGQRLSPPSYNFLDLVSLYVVSELRKRGVPLTKIRVAEEWLRKECGYDRPLATTHLYSAGKDILVRLSVEDGVEHRLVAASRYGQGAIEEAFHCVMERVLYEDGVAIRWTPWPDVEVDPRRQFGAPCVAGTGIQTATLYGFVQVGDDPATIAELYSLPLELVEHAVAWEKSLARAA